jgi:hypothetical protein
VRHLITEGVEAMERWLILRAARAAGVRWTIGLLLACAFAEGRPASAEEELNLSSFNEFEPEAGDDEMADSVAPDYCESNACCHQDHSFGLLSGCPIQPTDHCYDDFISPMTNPVYFEDPRNLTEARVIFLNHKVPNNAGGGDIQLYALQVRAALTDRLSLIATKDGYVVSSQTLLSTGVVYELPVGSHRTRQGNGGGAFDLFLTGGTEICCDGHWLSALGLVLPADESEESTWWYWSNHWDYEVASGIYTLAEVNWYHWLESGNNGIPGLEVCDLLNFGSSGVAGNDIVSGAFGLKFKPQRDTEIGVAWEVPLTERRDVLENRLTVDFIRRF